MGRGDVMEREELRAWLGLVMAPGIGPATARKLLAALGSPQAVMDASSEALNALGSARAGAALKALSPEQAAELETQTEATLAWLHAGVKLPDGREARHLLSLADPRYPATLLEAADPPLLLFAQGRLECLDRPSLAVVGSRHPTPQGEDNARAFSQALSEAGVTVVSGLARGVDAAAHEGGLAGPGGTIAVVGTGLDIAYPKAHTGLAARIGAQGLMLSEFMLGTPPLSPNFPKRNRIVAALTRGTLVVEAALQSGSLITARLAAEMGREVLAIPGSIHSPQSRGCHALIKQGAKLVETAQDVLEELRLDVGPLFMAFTASAGQGQGHAAGASPERRTVAAGQTEAVQADAAEGQSAPGFDDTSGPQRLDPVLAAMGYDPVSQEALSARTGMGAAELGARLLELELMGHVARLPGQLFQRIGMA